LNCQAKD